jgi:hypothetical protein
MTSPIISAKEIHTQTDKMVYAICDKLIEKVMENIHFQSMNGYYMTSLNVKEYNSNSLNRVIDMLKNNGYILVYKNNIITIRW